VLFKNTYPLTSANEPSFAHACRHNTSECDEYDVNDPFNCGESSYEYMEEGNKDRLLEFNGGNGSGNGNGNGNGSFRYDVIGNPFEYRNKELKWDNLRNLASFGDIRFEYDASGIRTIKHSDGSPYGKRSQWSASETRFLWAGDRLLGERRMSAYEDIDPCVCPSRSANDCHSCDSGDSYPRNDGEYTTYANASVTDITYIHGADGVIGLEISKNGGNDKETYYYRKNIQGDVTHILDDEGIIRSQYVYDAWGNHRVLDENGDENKNDEFIGNVNPIRYRSYYYDVETKLYYLRTRYYDPVTGRFVNADSISVLDVSQTHINGLNLYAYCVNNPIMYVDAEGRWFNPFRMAADVIGGAVGFVSNAIVKPAVNSFVSAASWMNTNIFQPIGNVVNSVVEWVQDNYVTILMIAAAVAITVVTGGAGGVVGGMLLGAALGGGMSIVQQGIENGFDNINWMDVGVSALIGGAAGALTGGAGGAIASRIASTVAGKAIGSALSRAGSAIGSAISSAGRSLGATARSLISTGTKVTKAAPVTTTTTAGRAGAPAVTSTARSAKSGAALQTKTTATNSTPGAKVDNITNYYRGGDNMTVRAHEVKLKGGMVQPKRGISVNSNPLDPNVVNFGGAYRLANIPKGLTVRFTKGTHYEIIPTQAMTLNQYQNLLNMIKLIKWH